MAVKFHLSIFCVTILLLCGCSTVVVRKNPLPVRAADEVRFATIPIVEALLAQRCTVAQAVSGTWKDHAFAAEVIMKGEDGKFTAVFLAPQMRLATITLTPPHTICYERAAQIPRMFDPEYALADLAFANLDVDALRRATEPVLLIEEDADGTRRISAGGRLIAELRKNPDSTRTFRNHVHGYEYTLRDIPLQ